MQAGPAHKESNTLNLNIGAFNLVDIQVSTSYLLIFKVQ